MTTVARRFAIVTVVMFVTVVVAFFVWEGMAHKALASRKAVFGQMLSQAMANHASLRDLTDGCDRAKFKFYVLDSQEKGPETNSKLVVIEDSVVVVFFLGLSKSYTHAEVFFDVDGRMAKYEVIQQPHGL